MQIHGFELKTLDRAIAEKHVKAIAALVDQIPQVTYTEEEILAESKGDRILTNKWEHSLILFDKDTPIAVLISYERAAEHNEQYPHDTLYIGELAVHKDYQGKGIAKELLKSFISINEGKTISVQTNSAEWNNHVINLYKSVGFVERAIKEYDNRTDVVLFNG